MPFTSDGFPRPAILVYHKTMGKLTSKKRITEGNLDEIPKQSGIYLLYRGNKSPYVGSAGARRLQARIKEQLRIKRGITSFRYRPTSSSEEARRLEKKYKERFNPKQKRI